METGSGKLYDSSRSKIFLSSPKCSSKRRFANSWHENQARWIFAGIHEITVYFVPTIVLIPAMIPWRRDSVSSIVGIPIDPWIFHKSRPRDGHDQGFIPAIKRVDSLGPSDALHARLTHETLAHGMLVMGWIPIATLLIYLRNCYLYTSSFWNREDSYTEHLFCFWFAKIRNSLKIKTRVNNLKEF